MEVYFDIRNPTARLEIVQWDYNFVKFYSLMPNSSILGIRPILGLSGSGS